MSDNESSQSSPPAVRLAELRDVLEGSVTFGRRMREDLDFTPAAGSPLEREGDELGDRQSMLEAFQYANLFLTAGEDQMVGLSRLLIEPTLQFAPDVLGRSALEAFSRAWHLLEPNIGPSLRRARYLNERVAVLAHSKKVAMPPENRSQFAERLQQLWSEAEKDHQILRNKKGRPIGVEEIRPNATQAVELLFEDMRLGKVIGMLMYQHYSSVTHSNASGLLDAYSFEEVPSGGGIQKGKPSASFSYIEWGAALPVLGWLLAAQRLITYAGWNATDFGGWHTHAFKVVIKDMRTRPTKAKPPTNSEP